jgi:hypothetical protein
VEAHNIRVVLMRSAFIGVAPQYVLAIVSEQHSEVIV